MPDIQSDLVELKTKITSSNVPEDLKEQVATRIDQLSRMTDSPTFLPEFDRLRRYIDWIVQFPWNATTQDNLDLTSAKKVLDTHHYGLEEIKDRILEYLAVMKLKQEK